MSARILIASADERRSRSLRRTLEAHALNVCCVTTNANEALERATAHRPDIALIDAALPGDGVTTVANVTQAAPKTAVIVLTASSADDELLSVLRAGACGYLPENIDASALVSAVRAVLNGEAAIPRSVVTRVIEELRVQHQRRLQRRGSTSVRLTDREWEVFELLNQGLTTREIGRVLYVSQVTVRSHIAAVVKKLGVTNRDEALRAVSHS